MLSSCRLCSHRATTPLNGYHPDRRYREKWLGQVRYLGVKQSVANGYATACFYVLEYIDGVLMAIGNTLVSVQALAGTDMDTAAKS